MHLKVHNASELPALFRITELMAPQQTAAILHGKPLCNASHLDNNHSSPSGVVDDAKFGKYPSPLQQDEIRKEAQTMSLINHPNVVKAYCSFVVDVNLWVVMPFLAGGSCLHIMKVRIDP